MVKLLYEVTQEGREGNVGSRINNFLDPELVDEIFLGDIHIIEGSTSISIRKTPIILAYNCVLTCAAAATLYPKRILQPIGSTSDAVASQANGSEMCLQVLRGSSVLGGITFETLNGLREFGSSFSILMEDVFATFPELRSPASPLWTIWLVCTFYGPE